MPRRHSTEFKVRVVLEALREQKTLAELGSEHGVHPVQISQWKKQALDGLSEVFSARGSQAAKEEEALKDELYREIGRLKRSAARVSSTGSKKLTGSPRPAPPVDMKLTSEHKLRGLRREADDLLACSSP